MDNVPRATCIKLGLVGLSLIIILILALSIDVSDNADDKILIGHFKKVGSLSPGDPVRLRGLPVGSVKSVVVDPNQFNIIVTMRLYPHIILSDDSVASVRTTGLFGSPYIKLDPGGSSRNLNHRDRIVKTDDIIPIASEIENLIKIATQ